MALSRCIAFILLRAQTGQQFPCILIHLNGWRDLQAVVAEAMMFITGLWGPWSITPAAPDQCTLAVPCRRRPPVWHWSVMATDGGVRRGKHDKCMTPRLFRAFPQAPNHCSTGGASQVCFLARSFNIAPRILEVSTKHQEWARKIVTQVCSGAGEVVC